MATVPTCRTRGYVLRWHDHRLTVCAVTECSAPTYPVHKDARMGNAAGYAPISRRDAARIILAARNDEYTTIERQ